MSADYIRGIKAVSRAVSNLTEDMRGAWNGQDINEYNKAQDIRSGMVNALTIFIEQISEETAYEEVIEEAEE